jgi:SAM-dependent methyltransferase
MAMTGRPYYHRYDAHYRSLYEQGIAYWSDGPDHCAKNIAHVTDTLRRYFPEPRGRTLLEIGCGEGHLVAPIADLGFAYTGIDLSPAAIGKARDRTAGHRGAPQFEVADAVTAEAGVFKGRFDAVLDQACFHMLVVDTDARRYLGNVRRLMAAGSLFLMFNQACAEDAYDGPIPTVVEYSVRFNHDLSRPKRWEQVWNGREYIAV